MELTVSFVHPDGPVGGLNAMNALERVLRRKGFKFCDHGTNFKVVRSKGKRFSVYKSSDTTMRGIRKASSRLVKQVLFKHGVTRFKMLYRKEQDAKR